MDLWNIDLLDTHLDLLDRDIPSKHFVCLQDVLKTSSRHVFKTSSRHVFKTSWRRLQHNNFSSSKTSSRRLEGVLREVLRTSSRFLQDVFARRLQDVLENVWLLRWRRVEDVLKTSWRPTNICWVGFLRVNLFWETVNLTHLPPPSLYFKKN